MKANESLAYRPFFEWKIDLYVRLKILWMNFLIEFWQPQTVHGLAVSTNVISKTCENDAEKKQQNPNKKKQYMLEKKKSAKFTRIVSIGSRRISVPNYK